MGLIYKKGVYIFEELLDFDLIAGFTDACFKGLNIKEDLSCLGQFLDVDFDNFVYLTQVHSGIVVKLPKKGSLFIGDALLTDKKKVALIVRTADCLPLLFYDSVQKVIGTIHLGWRPANNQIIEHFIQEAQKMYGINLKDSFIGIGPGLRHCCFQVQPDFLDYAGFVDFVSKRDSSYFFDLVGFLKRSFVGKGMIKDNFLDSGICSKHSKNFYSARRNNTQHRTLSFIVQK